MRALASGRTVIVELRLCARVVSTCARRVRMDDDAYTYSFSTLSPLERPLMAIGLEMGSTVRGELCTPFPVWAMRAQCHYVKLMRCENELER